MTIVFFVDPPLTNVRLDVQWGHTKHHIKTKGNTMIISTNEHVRDIAEWMGPFFDCSVIINQGVNVPVGTAVAVHCEPYCGAYHVRVGIRHDGCGNASVVDFRNGQRFDYMFENLADDAAGNMIGLMTWIAETVDVVDA